MSREISFRYRPAKLDQMQALALLAPDVQLPSLKIPEILA